MQKTQHEAIEQIKLFKWAAFMECQHPELKLLYHIPNGGSRNRIEAAHLKQQGVKAGVPDLCLPVPARSFHGLYIEMKFGKNKPTEKQTEWLEALNAQGYAVSVCYGWEQAQKVLCWYLNIR